MDSSPLLGDDTVRIPLSKEPGHDLVASKLQGNGYPHDKLSTRQYCQSSVSDTEPSRAPRSAPLGAILVRRGEEARLGLIRGRIRQARLEHPLDAVFLEDVWFVRDIKQGLRVAALNAFTAEVQALVPWLLHISVELPVEAKDAQAAEVLFIEAGFERFGRSADGRLLLTLRLPQDKLSHARVRNPIFSHPYSHGAIGAPSVFFGTSSEKKTAQFCQLFSCHNVILLNPTAKAFTRRLVEPQVDNPTALDEEELVRHPLKLIARFLGGNRQLPFLIEDTMLFIEFFNRDYDESPELPGFDTKRWWRQLGSDGVIELMGRTQRRRARYVSQIGGYLGRRRYVHARGEVGGRISRRVRVRKSATADFPRSNPFFFHSIFIPDGATRTLAQMEPLEFCLHDYRRRSVVRFLEQLELHADRQLELAL